MYRSMLTGLSLLILAAFSGCSSQDKKHDDADRNNGGSGAAGGNGAGGGNGGSAGRSGSQSVNLPTRWTDNGADVQDVTPWGRPGAGIGAPEPASYLGSDTAHDPECYRYYSADGTGDGSSASNPAGDAIAAINAICGDKSAAAAAAGKRLCLKRGDEFRAKPAAMTPATLSFSGCQDITVEDYGDQTKPRPKLMGSRVATGNWTKTEADARIYRLNLNSIVDKGYTWTASGQTHTDEERVDQIFFDGKKMLLARHPNFGQGNADPTFDTRREPTGNSMLVMDQGFEDRRAIRSSALPTTSILQNPVDWTSAVIHFKDITWISDATLVTGYNAANHELTTRVRVAPADPKQKGFFLANHIAALDSETEWYYDAKAKDLYFWPPENANPNEHRIDVSFARYNTPAATWDPTPRERRGYHAFAFIYSKDVTVKNLEVRHFSGEGVTGGGSGAAIRDCHFDGIGESAINLIYNIEESRTHGLDADPLVVENTRIENVACNGILMDGSGSSATNNTLLNVGSLEQFGPNGQGMDGVGCGLTVHETGFGIKLGPGDGLSAKYNFLERIGHNGVGFHGPNSVVEGNVVHLASVSKGDSGGVKCWAYDTSKSAAENFSVPGVSGSRVERNIVVETIGPAEGVPYPGMSLGDGFFIDFGCQASTFTNNIAARNTTQGLLFTIDRNQTATHNVVFGNAFDGGDQVLFGNCELDNCSNTFNNNLVVATSATERSLATYRIGDLTADENIYYNPFAIRAAPFPINSYNPAVCSLLQFPPGATTCYDLPSWQAAIHGEARSRDTSVLWRDEYASDYLSDDLVADAAFDSPTPSWTAIAGTATREEGGPNGGQLRLSAGSNEVTIQAIIPAKKDVSYEVSLRSQFANSSDTASHPLLELATSTHDWENLRYDLPTGGNAFRLENAPSESAVLFKARKDDTGGVLRISTKSADLWIDDLHVREVETYRVPRGVVLRPNETIPRAARIALYINPSLETQTVSLGSDTMLDTQGQPVTGTFQLEPMSSRALVAGAKLGLGKTERDFGAVAVGGSVRQRPVLSSIGASKLTITSVAIREKSSPFAVSNNCDTKQLDPSGACALDLTFAPTQAGSFEGTLVITTNDGQGGERTVLLKGKAN